MKEKLLKTIQNPVFYHNIFESHCCGCFWLCSSREGYDGNHYRKDSEYDNELFYEIYVKFSTNYHSDDIRPP